MKRPHAESSKNLPQYRIRPAAPRTVGTRNAICPMSRSKPPSLSRTKAENFMRATALCAAKLSVASNKLSTETEARNWLQAVIVGRLRQDQIVRDIGDCDHLSDLLVMVQSGRRIIRNRALSVLAGKKGISGRATSRIIGVDPRSYYKYLTLYQKEGIVGLLIRKPSSNRKFDSDPLKQAVFSLLHEPPSNHKINRATWRMADLSEVLAQKGHQACPDVIRKIIKDAGYRWRNTPLRFSPVQ